MEDSLEIHNIVLLVDSETQINLEALATSPQRTIYEPEQFPGVITSHKGITYNIFQSGKIICTGLKSIAQLEEVKHFVRTLPINE